MYTIDGNCMTITRDHTFSDTWVLLDGEGLWCLDLSGSHERGTLCPRSMHVADWRESGTGPVSGWNGIGSQSHYTFYT